MRTEAHYVLDIVAACDAIERFVAGKTAEQFQADDYFQAAIHSKLVIIGEAITHLSPELTDRYPVVPWQQIRGFRNLIIHGYFRIDWDVMWGAAIKDAPALRDACLQIMAKEFPHLDPERY